MLRKVHAVLVAMLRGHGDLLVDTCSVRAKRGGDLTGPTPTDRGKPGSKYHLAVTGEGTPIACVVTAANVNGPSGNAEGGTLSCSSGCS